MNKANKQKLIKDALAKRFDPVVKELHNRRTLLATKALRHAAGTPPITDPEWLSTTYRVKITRGPFEYRYRYDHSLLDHEFKIDETIFVPIRLRNSCTVEVPKHLEVAFTKLGNDILQYLKDAAQVEQDLIALLATVRTYKQLQAAWPEGENLYKFMAPVSSSRDLVDPSIVQRLTSELTP